MKIKGASHIYPQIYIAKFKPWKRKTDVLESGVYKNEFLSSS